MNLLDFVVLALASGAVVDAWFLGSLFASARAFFEEKGNRYEGPADNSPGDPDIAPAEDELPGWMRAADRAIPDAAAELFNCPFCLSHHVPYILLLLFYAPALFLPAPFSTLLKLPAYSLAATQLCGWSSKARRSND